MDLPVMPPVQPMLAKSVTGIPAGEVDGGLSFEPKWDGFRCIVFRDGDEVELARRKTKELTRYFPEVVAASGAAARADRARRRDLPRVGDSSSSRCSRSASIPRPRE